MRVRDRCCAVNGRRRRGLSEERREILRAIMGREVSGPGGEKRKKTGG